MRVLSIIVVMILQANTEDRIRTFVENVLDPEPPFKLGYMPIGVAYSVWRKPGVKEKHCRSTSEAMFTCNTDRLWYRRQAYS